jgi:hypothetical protein
MLATGAVDRLKRRSRPVNGPLSLAFDSVNAFLQFYFNERKNDGNLRLLAGLRNAFCSYQADWQPGSPLETGP